MNHGTSSEKLIREQQNTVVLITIGEDCWLGANVTVRKGSKIENGAIIGAKGLVKGEIPENAFAVGIPTRDEKFRE